MHETLNYSNLFPPSAKSHIETVEGLFNQKSESPEVTVKFAEKQLKWRRLDQYCLVTCCKFFDKNIASQAFFKEFYKIFQKSYTVEWVKTIVSKTFFIASSYPPVSQGEPFP